MGANAEGPPFGATVLDTFAVKGRGRFVEIEILHGTIVRGAFISIETSAGERVAEVHAVEFVDHLGVSPRGNVALGISALDEQVLPTIGGNVQRVYPCPCCRHLTLSERTGYEICPICWWEDDGQDAHVVRGGPNGSLSLSEARANFARMGAMDEHSREHVRPPRDAERPR